MVWLGPETFHYGKPISGSFLASTRCLILRDPQRVGSKSLDQRVCDDVGGIARIIVSAGIRIRPQHASVALFGAI